MAEPEATPSCHLSLIVPAYNEAQRLGESLTRLIAWAAAQGYGVELIVVDDGSSDATAAIAEDAARDAGSVPMRVIRHERNRGKGAAVRTGALAAAGHYIMSADADLATPPEEFPKLLAALDAGAGVAAGSRVLAGGGDMRASQPAWRRLGGRLFGIVRRRLLLPDIEDTQCGFKAFSREAAQAVFSRQRLEGWAFDAEVLYLAQKLGFSVRQVPLEWHHIEGSTFRLGLRTAVNEIADLLRIRWMHRKT